MMDFEGACNATFIEELNGRAPEQVLLHMQQRMRRFHELLDEVECHKYTVDICRLIRTQAKKSGLSLDTALAVTFAHGVMIGCVMNAQELSEDLLK